MANQLSLLRTSDFVSEQEYEALREHRLRIYDKIQASELVSGIVSVYRCSFLTLRDTDGLRHGLGTVPTRFDLDIDTSRPWRNGLGVDIFGETVDKKGRAERFDCHYLFGEGLLTRFTEATPQHPEVGFLAIQGSV